MTLGLLLLLMFGLDPVLAVPLALVCACVMLTLLGSLTRALRRRSARSVSMPAPQDKDAPAKETQAEEAMAEMATAESTKLASPTLPPIPQEQTAGWWWVQLLSGKAVLGLVFLPLQPVILLINSYVLALRLEVLLGRVGESLFELSLLGWNREITLYDLVGCLISLLQILLAAAFVHSASKTGRLKWTSAVALCGLLSTITLEVILSFRSGLIDGSLTWVAALNGLLALSMALTDVVCGIFLIEHLLIPFALTIAWTIASPFRAVARRVRRRQAKPKPTVQGQPSRALAQSKTRDRRLLINTLDEAFRTLTLRNYEAIVLRLLRKILKRFRVKKGKEQLCHSNS
jgi:hypothetical protein